MFPYEVISCIFLEGLRKFLKKLGQVSLSESSCERGRHYVAAYSRSMSHRRTEIVADSEMEHKIL